MMRGAFILSPIPQAALAYLWVITLPSLFAVLSMQNIWFNVVGGLLLVYAMVVTGGSECGQGCQCPPEVRA